MAATASLPHELDGHRLLRRAAQAGALIGVAGLAVVLTPGLGAVRDELADAHAGWLAAAVALEVLSGISYVLLFRAVFCRRLGWRTSWEIGWSEQAVGSLVPASGAGGLALGAWVLHRGGMPADRIARRSVAFFLLKSSVNFVAVAALGLLAAAALIGPDLPLALTLVPALMSVAALAAVVALPRLGPGRAAREDDGRLRRGWAAVRVSVVDGVREAVALVRSGDWMAIAGAVGYWAFDNAVLWATFHAFGADVSLTVVLLGYLIGQLGGLLPLPGGVGGIDGGLIGTLVLFGAPGAVTAAAVVAYRLAQFWVPLLVGAVAFASLRRDLVGEREQPARLRLAACT
ncbi:flippase-like domain-containing protein [Conexibacter sp. SYSU D00693]|uniref:flippase-like domain-containing protein n=1 Tax=Conexibacter sp. SYSU D00693 TaxID=2812560 RepID=UPI00196B206A|nr:flippase-like domain-containing protein [Conexibacter sp. SYSU D00693]